MIQVTPVILCGGAGTRLWPLSREGFPKQFLGLTGRESLFQMATKRLMGLESKNLSVAGPLVVTGEDHRFLVSEQLREIGLTNGTALLEPVGRNTAPALTLAALAAEVAGQDPILVVTPADQIITNDNAFRDAMHTAILCADAGDIAILGVVPNCPETGYGYIQVTDHYADAFKHVKRFIEKPDVDTAREYLSDGGYFWNAGLVVIKSSVWLKALGVFRQDILDATRRAWGDRHEESNYPVQFVRPSKAGFAAIPSESIDYAVLENCPGSGFSIKMVSMDAGWSDLGAWDAVWDILPKDELGNAYFGDVLTSESCNTLVHASSRLVSLVGVKDIIVVETPDAVLVVQKDRSQDVKRVVHQLNLVSREEHTQHRKVHRPWGWYDTIDKSDRFKVKRIQVNAGGSLSLQKHNHRAEHWVVVKGKAEVTVGEKVIFLSENQSIDIPLGEMHRLTNVGDIPLEIVEIQTGDYLEEDDIVRFEDKYGRKSS